MFSNIAHGQKDSRPVILVVQIQIVCLLVGSLVRLLVGKSYHTKQKDAYSLPTNNPTNNHTNWIWMRKKDRTLVLMLTFASFFID